MHVHVSSVVHGDASRRTQGKYALERLPFDRHANLGSICNERSHEDLLSLLDIWEHVYVQFPPENFRGRRKLGENEGCINFSGRYKSLFHGIQSYRVSTETSQVSEEIGIQRGYKINERTGRNGEEMKVCRNVEKKIRMLDVA